jgi:hypothetical protein
MTRRSGVMRTFTLPALALLGGALSAPAQATNETYRLRATVVDVRRLDEGVTTIDPAHGITVRIESISPPLAGYTNGSFMAFVFPGSARVFMTETAKGRKYAIVASREVHEGVKGPWRLERAIPVGEQGPAGGAYPATSGTNGAPAAAGHRHWPPR